MTASDLGESNDLAVATELLAFDGRTLVDVGCAAGDLARGLAERGATVIGVEPDPVQAEKNRQVTPVPGVTFLEASAEAIPLESGAADGVIFSRSLHHVPATSMDQALGEAVRLLKPDDGFLYAVEPDLDSPFTQLMRSVHDESKERRAAWAALDRVRAQFDRLDDYCFTRVTTFPDFASFVERQSAVTFAERDAARIDTAEIRALFETGRGDGEYRFPQLMLVRLLRGVASSG